MVDLLVFIFIYAVDGMRKMFITMWKGSWLLCKFFILCGFVPLIDAAMLALALVLYIRCKIFKQQTPKLVHVKYGIVRPSWESV